MAALTLLDWIVVAILLGSVLLGAWRGFLYEVVTLAGWVVAFVAAQTWAADLAVHLPLSGSTGGLRHAVAFVLIFIGGVFGAGLFAALIRRLLGAVGLRPVDRALGAGFGILRGLALLLAIGFVAHWTPLHSTEFWRLSATTPWIDSTVRSFVPWVEAWTARAEAS
ncbi:CvpA family protein [Tibeticola sp.]|uniref:CvpA family protein n=1 Tax=Tibeticola sp. TaxID=2005368 RepID=UPI0025884129|nr:CvpA family protein [Tibeticola sp.]